MPLGTKVNLGPGDVVLVGVAAPPKRGTTPQFSVHIYCGQMAEWMKTPFDTEVALGPGHIVLDMDSVSARKWHSGPPSLFGPCLLWSRSPISATAELLLSCLNIKFCQLSSVSNSSYVDFACILYASYCSSLAFKEFRFLFCFFELFLYFHHHTTTVLRPFFRDHPFEPVPKENFWTLWCKGRLTEADTDCPAGRHSIRMKQCLPPPSVHFFTGRMPFLPPNHQCQSTEGN